MNAKIEVEDKKRIEKSKVKAHDWKHSCQTQKGLALTVRVIQKVISHRLNSLEMIKNQGNYLPDIKSFLHRIWCRVLRVNETEGNRYRGPLWIELFWKNALTNTSHTRKIIFNNKKLKWEALPIVTCSDRWHLVCLNSSSRHISKIGPILGYSQWSVLLTRLSVRCEKDEKIIVASHEQHFE